MESPIMFWATVLSPIVGTIAIIAALVASRHSSRDAEKQIKAVYSLLDVFVASQNPNMLAAKRQYEQQLSQLDNQIQEAEEKLAVVNPFLGQGSRMADIEWDEKKRKQKQQLEDLRKQRSEMATQMQLIQSYLDKAMM